MMAGRFMIDGIWCDVPEGENLNDWLNENVSVIIDPNTFEIIGRLRRIDVIERVRKSGRGRGVSRAKIVKRFKKLNPVHTPGVLVKNHGPFAWGKDANDAVHNAVVMEQVAKMASIAFAANPHLTMNSLLIEKHFSRKHGPNAYYGQK